MKITMLMVEDDPNDVFFMRRAMKLAGMTNPLQVASDGREAIDYLKGAGAYGDRAQFPLPSLVLLDLKLPYVMGLDVLKWIREQPHFETMCVFILTSSNLPSDISQAYSRGANAYLVKPSNPVALGAVVDAIRHCCRDFEEQASSAPACESAARPARVLQSVLY